MEAYSLLINLRKGMQSSSEQPLVGEERYVTNLKTATDMEFNLDFMKLFSLGMAGAQCFKQSHIIAVLCSPTDLLLRHSSGTT